MCCLLIPSNISHPGQENQGSRNSALPVGLMKRRWYGRNAGFLARDPDLEISLRALYHYVSKFKKNK